MIERAPLDEDERKSRSTNRLIREADMERAARVTPEPTDDED